MNLRKLFAISLVIVLAGLIAAAGCDKKSDVLGPGNASAAVVNSKCPMMDNAIDPQNVPAELTREFKGEKIGFCCAACPAAWDKLSDEEKTAKLAALEK